MSCPQVRVCVCVCVSTPVSKDTTLVFSNLPYQLFCTEAGGHGVRSGTMSNEAT